MSQVFAVDIKSLFSPANNFDTIGSLVSVVIRNAFVVAGVIAFALLVAGGIGFIGAAGAGDTKKLERGRNMITSAIIGLIVIIGSVWIIQATEALTGMTIVPFQ